MGDTETLKPIRKLYGFYTSEYDWYIQRKSKNEICISKTETRNNDPNEEVNVSIFWKNLSQDGPEFSIQHKKHVLIADIDIYDKSWGKIEKTVNESKYVNYGTDYYYETVVKTAWPVWFDSTNFSTFIRLSLKLSTPSGCFSPLNCTKSRKISLNLENLINDDRYCDIKLVVSGKQILAQKAVLAAPMSS